jgi:uncharacterized protein (TIGR03435 family)
LALAVAGLLTTVTSEKPNLLATVTDSSLSLVSPVATRVLGVNDAVRAGDHVRASAGAVLALADGSRVEMRVHSELALERVDDGIRIRLSEGGVIVNAAKQGDGHLYVQTKDVTVSVVGTVFLVNAEETGSRVAVIQGEVQVQQGAAAKTLLPGEQVATNPSMKLPPVSEEISWSRHVEEHLALLQQQTAVVAAPTPPQNPPEPRVAFEVASIRPSAPAPVQPGGRGGGPGGCIARAPEVNPGRLAITCFTLDRLIDLAYGMKNCPVSAREGPRGAPGQQPGGPTYARSCISGEPEWGKSDRFDLQATIPQGSHAYTRSELQSGDAPQLQRMIQTLLAERFKLVLHRETKEAPVYNLVVARPGRMKLSDDQTPPGDIPFGLRGNALPRGVMLNCSGVAIQISSLIGCFQTELDRPLIDKTDLTGLYDIPPRPTDPNATPGARGGGALPLALEQLGLKVESARGSVEFLVIDHAEKPSEN